jgi:hypothetical protein
MKEGKKEVINKVKNLNEKYDLSNKIEEGIMIGARFAGNGYNTYVLILIIIII